MIPLERGIEFQFIGLLMLLAIGAWYWAMQQVVGWRDRTFPPAPPKSPSRPTPPKQSATLDWAGRALANPPEDLPATIVYCIQRWGNVPLLFPPGWYRDNSGKPDCAAVSFLNGTYHILISGQSRIGKDNLATQIMLSLALCAPPEQVQLPATLSEADEGARPRESARIGG